jgi:hypothetical protein
MRGISHANRRHWWNGSYRLEKLVHGLTERGHDVVTACPRRSVVRRSPSTSRTLRRSTAPPRSSSRLPPPICSGPRWKQASVTTSRCRWWSPIGSLPRASTSKQTGAGEADQRGSDSLLDRACDAVLRVPQVHRGFCHHRQRGAHAACTDSADGVHRRRRCCGQCPRRWHHRSGWSAAVPPTRPHPALIARGDSREVVADSAGYWGIPIDERDLVPGDGATLFDIRFEDWILETAAKG